MKTDQNGQKPMATGSGTSSGVSEPAVAMINYYGADGEAFIRLFAPHKQEYAAANIERTYFGQAPTIRCIVEGYGRKTALGFFLVQMEDINRFSNARIKLSTEQQSMLTAIFINQ